MADIWSAEICQLKHDYVIKEIEGIKTLVKYMHEGDERFIEREVSQISRKLDKLSELEERMVKLEKWRTYALGAVGVLFILTELIIKVVLGG